MGDYNLNEMYVKRNVTYELYITELKNNYY